MKTLPIYFIAIALLAVLPVDADTMQISEVLYDPLATETGGEALELYNPTMLPINIGGWIIKTKSSEQDAVIPLGTVVTPHHYFLLADEGWNLNRDDASYPLADYEEAMTLTNTNAGLALLNNGTIIDALAWGNESLISLDLRRGIPTSGTQEGFSLQRINSTGNNKEDFISLLPSFKNSSFENQEYQEGRDSIDIAVNIAGQAPSILSFVVVTDDLEEEGNQIFPLPGQERTIQVEALLFDQDSISDIENVSLTWFLGLKEFQKETQYNETTALYTATLSLSSSEAAGLYALSLEVKDKENNTLSKLSSFEYKELLALEVTTGSLQFENVIAGSLQTLNDSLQERPKILNNGNIALNLGAFGEETETNQSLSFDWLKLSFEEEQFFQLSEFPTLTETILMPGQERSLDLELSIPETAGKGKYEARVTILGVKQ